MNTIFQQGIGLSLIDVFILAMTYAEVCITALAVPLQSGATHPRPHAKRQMEVYTKAYCERWATIQSLT